MSVYKWVHHNGTTLYSVGILPDGTLHNPRGYPDDDVRSAVLATDARRHERRSQAAKKAGDTRRRRIAQKIYAVAKRLTLNGASIGPQNTCAGRGLGDQQSIERGVGSECWQGVLDVLMRERGATS